MTLFLLPFFVSSLVAHILWSLFRMALDIANLFSSLITVIITSAAIFAVFLANYKTPLAQAKSQYLQQPSSDTLRELILTATANTENTNSPQLSSQLLFTYKNQLTPADRENLRSAIRAQTGVDKEIQFWKTLYETQPTDRDVLTNLSLLYRSAGEFNTAEKFSVAAKQVDPNFGDQIQVYK